MSSETKMDFDTFVDRRGTASEKWRMYEERNVLPLWLADMDFLSPPSVIEALHERVRHGVFGYTSVPDELVSVVVSMLRETYAWEVDPTWLVWLPGLVSGLNISCRAVGEAGDDVLTAVPVYPPFLSAPGNMGRELIKVPLVEQSGRWCFDFDRLEHALTPRTRLLLLCNPHNPVGRVFDRQELETLAEICLARDIVLCSDEIHCGLILDEYKVHIPTATLAPEVAARTITLMAPSKTYNLPGLGCSFAIISEPRLRTAFKKAMAGIVPPVNALAFTAAAAAYGDDGSWHAALLDYLRGNRGLVTDRIGRIPGLSMAHVEATYLAWIDTRELGLENPGKFFTRAGVGLGNGKAFGGPGFVRLTFGCPRSLLNDALDRMEGAIVALPESDSQKG